MLREKNLTNDAVTIFYTDNGTEFCSKDIKKFYKKNDISHISLGGNAKAAQAERFIRTLKNFIGAAFFNQKKFNIIEKFNSFISMYNHRINLNDGLSPFLRLKSVVKKPDFEQFKDIKMSFNRKMIAQKKRKILNLFPIGCCVRIRTMKAAFDKEAIAEKYSHEKYTVYSVKMPTFYYENILLKLKNSKGQILDGPFLQYELKRC